MTKFTAECICGTVWPCPVDLERQLAEAKGKLERIESEGCACGSGNPFGCIVHDDQSVIARILKEGE